MATFVRDSPETVIHEKPLPKGEAKYEYVILILTECRSVTATSRMSMLRDLILHGLTDMLCGQSKTDSWGNEPTNMSFVNLRHEQCEAPKYPIIGRAATRQRNRGVTLSWVQTRVVSTPTYTHQGHLIKNDCTIKTSSYTQNKCDIIMGANKGCEHSNPYHSGSVDEKMIALSRNLPIKNNIYIHNWIEFILIEWIEFILIWT